MHKQLVLIIVTAVGTLFFPSADTRLAIGQDAPKQRPPSGESLKKAPMTISMSTIGDFGKGNSWYLSINSAGRAELTIGFVEPPKRREFVVSAAQLDALRAALIEERFFELADQYGENVPDGSSTTIAVTVGDATKSIRTRFLMNWVQSAPERLREPARALRVMKVVRNWFDDADAVDLRKYDQMVIDAAEKK